MAQEKNSSTKRILTAVAIGGLLWLLLKKKRQPQPTPALTVAPQGMPPQMDTNQSASIRGNAEPPRDIEIPPIPSSGSHEAHIGESKWRKPPIRPGKISIGDDQRRQLKPIDSRAPQDEIMPITVDPVDKLRRRDETTLIGL